MSTKHKADCTPRRMALGVILVVLPVYRNQRADSILDRSAVELVETRSTLRHGDV